MLLVLCSYSQHPSRKEADSLIASMTEKKPQADRLNSLLLLADFHIFKPGENKADLDSAAGFIMEAKKMARDMNSDEALAYSALMESCVLRERGQRQQAKEIAEKAVQDLKNGKNKFYTGRACYELAEYYNHEDTGQLKIKIVLVEQAAAAFGLSGHIEWKAYSLRMLADIYSWELNYDINKALATIKQSLEAYQSINYKQLQGVYSIMGELYKEQSNYKQALFYELEALRTAEEVGDTSIQLCHINNTIGQIYGVMQNYEMAISYFKRSMETAQRNNDVAATLQLALNITLMYSRINKSAEALEFLKSIPEKYLKTTDATDHMMPMAYMNTYVSLGQFSQAKPYCDVLLKLDKSGSLEPYVCNNAYRIIARYYIGIRQYPEARHYLEKNKILNEKLGDPVRKLRDLMVWYQLDSIQGNYKTALTHLLEQKKIGDSLLNAAKIQQFQQLEIEYETSK